MKFESNIKVGTLFEKTKKNWNEWGKQIFLKEFH